MPTSTLPLAAFLPYLVSAAVAIGAVLWVVAGRRAGVRSSDGGTGSAVVLSFVIRDLVHQHPWGEVDVSRAQAADRAAAILTALEPEALLDNRWACCGADAHVDRLLADLAVLLSTCAVGYEQAMLADVMARRRPLTLARLIVELMNPYATTAWKTESTSLVREL